MEIGTATQFHIGFTYICLVIPSKLLIFLLCFSLTPCGCKIKCSLWNNMEQWKYCKLVYRRLHQFSILTLTYLFVRRLFGFSIPFPRISKLVFLHFSLSESSRVECCAHRIHNRFRWICHVYNRSHASSSVRLNLLSAFRVQNSRCFISFFFFFISACVWCI